MQFEVTLYRGAQARPVLPELARLRLAVFREWPYLYDGEADYEELYLQRYAACADFLLVLVTSEGRVVGASTGLPMRAEIEDFKSPLRETGSDPEDHFYCGESVVLREFRGHGLGKRFFAEREAHARRLGLLAACFCAVERAADDPRKPQNAPDLQPFWRRLGYRPLSGARARLSWKEIDGVGEVEHTLAFWAKPLNQA